MRNIYLKINELLHAGSGLVIATVTGASGSTPQKPGSSAIFRNGELIDGTVGGGVAEGRVQEASLKCSMSGKSRYLQILLNSDISNKEEAICGGELTVLLDANPANHHQVFRMMSKSLAEREAGVLITMVTAFAEEHVLVNRYWMTNNQHPAIPGSFLESIMPEVNRLLATYGTDEYLEMKLTISGEEPSSTFYLEPVFPPPKLIIAGAGHIGKALSVMGRFLDFEVTVIDDRREFANSSNLPDADHTIVGDIGAIIAETVKDKDTYIVIVTRGHNDDAKALKACIGSGAFYIGMIGSKAKVAKMKADFLSNNWADEEEWAHVHTPVGIDIRSKTVQEIAVSIAAELVLVKNNKVKR
jgi:xanthine dehydrogenase accessory factor